MGAFVPPLPPQEDPQTASGFPSPAMMAENNPGAAGQMMLDQQVARDVASLTQAEDLILAVGAQHTQAPMVAEAIRAAQGAIREVMAAVQAAVQVGVRDEIAPTV